MPLMHCTGEDGKPGWRWGEEGACYTYVTGNKMSMMKAKKKAIGQAVAINMSKKRAGEPMEKIRSK